MPLDPITDREIAESREICAKASNPPWNAGLFDEERDEMTIYQMGSCPSTQDIEMARIAVVFSEPMDGVFIAHARTMLPRCLDRIAELEAENKRLREAAQHAADYFRSNMPSTGPITMRGFPKSTNIMHELEAALAGTPVACPSPEKT